LNPGEKKMNRKASRKQTGSITEFGAALVLFVGFILVPLISLSSIPGRYLLCQGVLNDFAIQLSHCEKPSEAQALVQKASWKSRLSAAGIKVTNERLALVAVTSDGTKQISQQPGQAWPKEWLPDSANPQDPFVYSLKLSCTCQIAIPGVASPLSLPLVGISHWENLARDPKSTNLVYFIEE
jgi:hypothetical protein